ncbi:MAG: hypothetical protein QFX33_00205 [Candidatus Nezhaarchaeota archaeon]|nr:hypothetical protein [Candidatus Nezhaarchaeota archaeon]
MDLRESLEPRGRLQVDGNVALLDATGLHYRELNALMRRLSAEGVENVELHNVNGQRYIGTGLKRPMNIIVRGTPGNDLGMFINGQRIFVYGNAQDGCGNTMNDGLIVVHGSVGDVAGYAMRGGRIFVRDDAGFRLGIHMKEYGGKKPIIVVGGGAGDFLGEYMAGGLILVLGLKEEKNECVHSPKFVGVGMHGGVIYMRGCTIHAGKNVLVEGVEDEDLKLIRSLVEDYFNHFNLDLRVNDFISDEFVKVTPSTSRPYMGLYR